MRKYLALTVATVLVLASCKSTSGGDTSAGPETQTSGSGPATTINDPRAPGVTTDTIKVGVPYVDLAAIKDIVHIDQGDFQKAYQAIFDDINAKGGINGRKLEPTFAPINPMGTAASDAACTKLTQDDPVFVAVGFFLNDAVLCYVDTNQTAVVGGSMTPERLAKAKAPWFTTDLSQDSETDVAKALAKAHKLDGKVAVVTTPPDKKLLDEQVLPALDQAGIKPVETAVIDAPTNDADATYAAAQTIAEKFKADGADKVLMVGQATAGSFNVGLLRTDYRPQLIFTNLNGAGAYTANATADLSIMKDALTGGAFGPSDDILALPGVTKECMDIERNSGLTIKPTSQVPKGDPDQFTSSIQACTQMYLLTAILKKAGPDLNYGTFETAGNSLGKIDLPGSPDQWTFGAPPSADGDPVVYVFQWDPTVNQFVRAKA